MAHHVRDHRSLWRLLNLAYRQSFKPSKRYAKLYRDHRDPELFREWLTVVLDPSNDIYLHPIYALGTTSETLGLFSFRYLWLFSKDINRLIRGPVFAGFEEIREFFFDNNLVDAMIKTENLKQDLIHALSIAGYELNDALIAKINESPDNKTNRSRRLPITELYDQQTLDLVAHRERLVIELHDYATPVIS